MKLLTATAFQADEQTKIQINAVFFIRARLSMTTQKKKSL